MPRRCLGRTPHHPPGQRDGNSHPVSCNTLHRDLPPCATTLSCTMAGACHWVAHASAWCTPRRRTLRPPAGIDDTPPFPNRTLPCYRWCGDTQVTNGSPPALIAGHAVHSTPSHCSGVRPRRSREAQAHCFRGISQVQRLQTGDRSGHVSHQPRALSLARRLYTGHAERRLDQRTADCAGACA